MSNKLFLSSASGRLFSERDIFIFQTNYFCSGEIAFYWDLFYSREDKSNSGYMNKRRIDLMVMVIGFDKYEVCKIYRVKFCPTASIETFSWP